MPPIWAPTGAPELASRFAGRGLCQPTLPTKTGNDASLELEAAGIELARPYTKNEQTGNALAFIYDPWGTYIELNERSIPR